MKNTKKVLVFLVTALILITCMSLLAGCGKKEETKNNEYEEPIKNMFNGIQNTDLDMYLSAYPDFINYKITQSNLNEIMNVYISMYGQDIKISYETKNAEEISKEDLATVQENVKIYYNKECKVEQGYNVEIEKTIKGNKDQQITITHINVYKIDGKWYTINF